MYRLCPCLQSLWNVYIHLISVKISVKWSANTLIKPECFSRPNFSKETHHTYPVERGLSIENYNIVVPEVSFDDIPILELNFLIFSRASSRPDHNLISWLGYYKVGSSSLLGPFLNALLKLLDCVWCYGLLNGQNSGHMFRHQNLCNFKIGVGRDNCSGCKISSFPW